MLLTSCHRNSNYLTEMSQMTKLKKIDSFFLYRNVASLLNDVFNNDMFLKKS